MLDPMTMMMLASNLNPGGQGNALLNPAGGSPTTAMMPQPPGPQAAAAAPGAGMAGKMGSLGQMLQGVQAPQGAEPKFSGGVSGSGLPYVSRIEDMVSPFLQATNPGQVGNLPTLGQLLTGGR